MSFKIAPCTHEAAKYAVEHWHYSKRMPTPPIIKFGVWEGDCFIGCVMFSRGGSNALGSPYGLGASEVCELTRIALTLHSVPVSKLISICVKNLKKTNPGLRLIVSYADANENHHGGIYQASNWIYSGTTAHDFKYIDVNGRAWHSRSVSSSGYKEHYGKYYRCPKPDSCEKILLKGKHRYLYPLDDEMRQKIKVLARPYPKRDIGASKSTSPNQGEDGGAVPTVSHHTSKGVRP